MEFKEVPLTFTDNEIYFDNNSKFEVMMDWEDNLMSASAVYACSKGGDILEVGFGMGISATYIQQHDIQSHTICEIHPVIVKKALEWAKDKPNVNIVEGDWYANKDNLGQFDGLFFDTYNDPNLMYFSSSLTQLVKKGGVATWWNSREKDANSYRIPNVEYQKFKINPPENSYFNHKFYHLPKWQH